MGARTGLDHKGLHLDALALGSPVVLRAPTSFRTCAARLVSSVGLAGDDPGSASLDAIELDDFDVVGVVDAELVCADVIRGIFRPHLVDVEELAARRECREFSSKEAFYVHTAGSPSVRPVSQKDLGLSRRRSVEWG